MDARWRRMSIPLRYTLITLVAAIAVALVYLFPPYDVEGSIIGGLGYYFYRTPPSSDGPALVLTPLMNSELIFIALSAVSALIALRPKARRSQKKIFIIGFGAELLTLIYSINRNFYILWFLLCVTDYAVFGVVLLLGIRWKRPSLLTFANQDVKSP